MDLDFLQGLISAVDSSGIDSLEISRGGTRIRIAKTPPPAHTVTQAAPAPVRDHAPAPAAAAAPAAAPAAPAAPPVVESRLSDVKSPMVGTFYRSTSPEAPAYVEPGSRVVKGQTLCILEAMKLMNELQAEISGVVREVCVENAEPVEYGQVLFRIEPEA
ncbi:MAG: acetyl-CoA carboxylase biotin carboxyl carrier protein [Gemmatimonadetes bacterium]|nr:acetyl-CoA carboxylase biotin carboxyl carrier protein [Gemmatimonadota bacterium]